MMDPFNLVLLCVMVCVISLPGPISLSTVWRSLIIPEQIEHTVVRMGAAINGSRLSEMCYGNVSLPKSDFWSDVSWSEDALLKDFIPKASSAVAIQNPRRRQNYDLGMLQPDLATRDDPLPAIDASSAASAPGEFDTDQSRYLEWDRGNVGEILYPFQKSFISITFVCFVLLVCALVYWTGTSIVARHRQNRFLQLANHEILEFIRRVQAKKAVILDRMDMASSTINFQLAQAFRQIMTDNERICTEFRYILEQEANVLRETLQQQVQAELERQTTAINEFVARLERIRQQLPGIEDFEATSQAFLNDIQRSRELMDGFSSCIHPETETHTSAASSVQQENTTPCSFPVTKNQPPAETASLAVNSKQSEFDETETEQLGDGGMREGLASGSAQWQMVVESSGFTPEEIELGRKIRRERVQKTLPNLAASSWPRVNKRRQRHRSLTSPGPSRCGTELSEGAW